MKIFAALDVSDKATHVCVIDGDGVVVRRGLCATDPAVLAATLDHHAPDLERVVMKTGPLSAFIYHGLIEWSSGDRCNNPFARDHVIAPGGFARRSRRCEPARGCVCRIAHPDMRRAATASSAFLDSTFAPPGYRPARHESHHAISVGSFSSSKPSQSAREQRYFRCFSADFTAVMGLTGKVALKLLISRHESASKIQHNSGKTGPKKRYR
jgi:hypothetical protein